MSLLLYLEKAKLFPNANVSCQTQIRHEFVDNKLIPAVDSSLRTIIWTKKEYVVIIICCHFLLASGNCSWSITSGRIVFSMNNDPSPSGMYKDHESSYFSIGYSDSGAFHATVVAIRLFNIIFGHFVIVKFNGLGSAFGTEIGVKTVNRVVFLFRIEFTFVQLKWRWRRRITSGSVCTNCCNSKLIPSADFRCHNCAHDIIIVRLLYIWPLNRRVHDKPFAQLVRSECLSNMRLSFDHVIDSISIFIHFHVPGNACTTSHKHFSYAEILWNRRQQR